MEIKKRIHKFGDGSYTEYYHKKGSEYYYHREDGPAIIDYNKDNSIYGQEYWINDEELSKERWEKEYGWKLQLKGTPMGEIFGV